MDKHGRRRRRKRKVMARGVGLEDLVGTYQRVCKGKYGGNAALKFGEMYYEMVDDGGQAGPGARTTRFVYASELEQENGGVQPPPESQNPPAPEGLPGYEAEPPR